MKPLLVACMVLSSFVSLAAGAERDWSHAGTIWILTTPEGANLPEQASVEGFPVLVRLRRDFFDFSQARPDGADIRFVAADGAGLAHQIEEWNPADGMASVWVRIPLIKGNDRQPITMRWGKSDAVSESNGAGVFNASNGFATVLHMDASGEDVVGTLQPKDTGTTDTPGVVGRARRFEGKGGICGGDAIIGLPEGASPNTSEAWIRVRRSNGRIVAWGNEQRQGKVVLQFRSPPHISTDCYFSDANVTGTSRLPMDEWLHIVHTYAPGDAKIYVNGRLDSKPTGKGTPLAVPSPAKLWVGGWFNTFDFVGDIDEVRVSKVTRSPEWIRLAYENQKPMQTLVGPVVQPGHDFAVKPDRLTVDEGAVVTFALQAGGAQKIFWRLKRGGHEETIATDTFNLPWNAGRVTGDETASLVVQAVYPTETKSGTVPLTINEKIPDPVFTLEAPATWDGRTAIDVVAKVSNEAAMQAAGATSVRSDFRVDGVGASQSLVDGRLHLDRAHKSGTLTATTTLDNGGMAITKTAVIEVVLPESDPWIARVPGADEQPQDHQFYPRGEKDEGTLFYNGTLDAAADAVFLTLFADGKEVAKQVKKVGADRRYEFAVPLEAGLIRYTVAFGTIVGGKETVLRTVDDIVCGDAYVIDGQSNAEATAWGNDAYAFTSPWIRSFGSVDGNPQVARLELWGEAAARVEGRRLQIGSWGMELGRRLVESRKMPICIINGAVGGTRIDQHQRNPADPEDVATIYGRLLWRVRKAGLTHGIRGVFWHQGENDQGADGPTGTFGWESYRRFFVDMASGWRKDYPNSRHIYVFQIWPKACAMGIDGSDNRLREVQRTLPTAFANLSVMSTLGIDPPGGCHYPLAGYAEFARLIEPLVARDIYGVVPKGAITAPDLERASFADGRRDLIVLAFDQPVVWSDALGKEFSLDGKPGAVASGHAEGTTLVLQLSAPSDATTITYLDSASWSPSRLLRGVNGIAALTFCEVPIEAEK
jgi:hypothetical protein